MIVAAVALLVVIVAVGAAFVLTRSTGVSDEDLQASLDERICSIDPKVAEILAEGDEFTGCSVTVTEDLVEIQAAMPQDLEAIGKEYGWWTAADLARMGQTRALDGMQSSSNGKVTWTYHPDNGLQIIVER